MSDVETPMESIEQAGGRTAWMAHVKKTMRSHKGKSLKQVLKIAAKTYKKSGKKTARKTRKGKKFLGMFGGAAPAVAETAAGAEAAGAEAAMAGGRRRRGGRKH